MVLPNWGAALQDCRLVDTAADLPSRTPAARILRLGSCPSLCKSLQIRNTNLKGIRCRMDAVNANVPPARLLYVSSQQLTASREKPLRNSKFDCQVSRALLLSQLRRLQLRRHEYQRHIGRKFD